MCRDMYALMIILEYLFDNFFWFLFHRLLEQKTTLLAISILLGLGVFLYQVDGPHKESLQAAEKYILW